MTDETKTNPLLVTVPNNVPVVFVNEVIGRGCLNGVVNLTMAVARFSPRDGEIAPDLVIAARLRMDMVCVRHMYILLGELISMNEPDDRSKPN